MIYLSPDTEWGGVGGGAAPDPNVRLTLCVCVCVCVFQGLQEQKIVFILFFQGDQLRSRVRKICEAFRATLYQCPETADERQEMTVAVLQRINDLRAVLHTTEQHSITQFAEIAQELDTWRTKVGILCKKQILPHCVIGKSQEFVSLWVNV